ncbi:MAG: GTPase HflX [Planctomycetota bacterium]
MDKLTRTDLAVAAERALLVCVETPDSQLDPHDPLGELRSLAKTAGAVVVDEMFARRRTIDPGYYVGSGKAEQIGLRVAAAEADVVIFDNDLSPAQIRDLEEVVKRKVLDRSELILDIFAGRARTHEARLQVELAQLEYTYPRLRHMWTHLERIAGGQAAVGGIGTRGPGEKQIEVDRRLVRKRVTDLKRQLNSIDKRKIRTVKSRSDLFTVCLVGYTNAGKSTLMNRLTDAAVMAEDKLFATLDTKTSRWNLGDGQTVLLSDTVGFVANLPHLLVASFKATLEEAVHADLLLHVADASHEQVDQQIHAVNEVLDEIGCADKDRQLVLNKSDQVNDPAVLLTLQSRYRDGLIVSAARGDGIVALTDTVGRRLTGGTVTVKLRVDFRNGRLMQYIAQHADVSHQEWGTITVDIDATMGVHQAEGLAQFNPDVDVLECH